MQINPKSIEQVARLSSDVKKVITESVNNTTLEEVSKFELPRMSLETVVPKANIIKTQEFDVQKAIEKFSDIKDTESIEKICREWHRDLDAMVKKFSGNKIPKEEIYGAHRESIESLDKYEVFSNKIFEFMQSGEGNPEEAMKVFEEHIEPIIIKSQETMRFVDNIPEVKEAYKKASAKTAKAYNSQKPATTSTVKTNVKQSEEQTQLPKAIEEKAEKITEPVKPTKTAISQAILEDLEKTTDINSASKLIFKLETNRNSIPAEEYAELSDLIVQKMSKIK